MQNTWIWIVVIVLSISIAVIWIQSKWEADEPLSPRAFPLEIPGTENNFAETRNFEEVTTTEAVAE